MQAYVFPRQAIQDAYKLAVQARIYEIQLATWLILFSNYAILVKRKESLRMIFFLNTNGNRGNSENHPTSIIISPSTLLHPLYLNTGKKKYKKFRTSCNAKYVWQLRTYFELWPSYINRSMAAFEEKDYLWICHNVH